MKVIAIWTQTLDGFIAKQKRDDLEWGSKIDRQWFAKVTREIGVVVMGRKTAELIGKPLPGRLNVVMTTKSVSSIKYQVLGIDKSNLVFTNKTPRKILKMLEKKGFDRVAICGGASIYQLWLEEKLVDEIWASVQPVIFGPGVPAVTGLWLDLELLSQEELGEGVMVLKYKVV